MDHDDHGHDPEHDHAGHDHAGHDHGHGLGHHHHGTLTGRALVAAILLNLAIFGVQIVGAMLSGSLALLSDAIHNLSDLATLALALLSTRLVLRAATKDYTFGWQRSEILVAFLNALSLFVIGGWLVWEGFEHLFEPSDVKPLLVMAFGAFGLFANLSASLVLRRHAKSDLNARSAFLHLATDAAESGAVVLGGALMLVGVPLVDPILTILIGLFTMKGAYDVLRDATNILVEGAPHGVSADDVAACLRRVDGVCDVHHVHVWSLSSTWHAASAHVRVPDQAVGDSRALVERMSRRLREECGVEHPTFQLEVADCQPSEKGCRNC